MSKQRPDYIELLLQQAGILQEALTSALRVLGSIQTQINELNNNIDQTIEQRAIKYAGTPAEPPVRQTRGRRYPDGVSLKPLQDRIPPIPPIEEARGPVGPGQEDVDALLALAKRNAVDLQLEKINEIASHVGADVNDYIKPPEQQVKTPEEILKTVLSEFLLEIFSSDTLNGGKGKISLSNSKVFKNDLHSAPSCGEIVEKYPDGFFTNQEKGGLQYLLTMHDNSTKVFFDMIDKDPVAYMLYGTPDGFQMLNLNLRHFTSLRNDIYLAATK